MTTKKDFLMAAELIRDNYTPNEGNVIDAFVAFFTLQNPRFDAARFRDACKPACGALFGPTGASCGKPEGHTGKHGMGR